MYIILYILLFIYIYIYYILYIIYYVLYYIYIILYIYIYIMYIIYISLFIYIYTYPLVNPNINRTVRQLKPPWSQATGGSLRDTSWGVAALRGSRDVRMIENGICGAFLKGGYTKHGWFILQNPSKMIFFRGTPML